MKPLSALLGALLLASCAAQAKGPDDGNAMHCRVALTVEAEAARRIGFAALDRELQPLIGWYVKAAAQLPAEERNAAPAAALAERFRAQPAQRKQIVNGCVEHAVGDSTFAAWWQAAQAPRALAAR